VALESGTYISDFNTSNPVDNTDTLATLGAHARLTKSFVKATFPNVTGAVTVTHTQLNTITSKVSTGLLTASGLTISTAKLAGRTTASTGALEEIAIGSGLAMSAGTLSVSVGTHVVEVSTGNGSGSGSTKIRRYTTTVTNTGTAITYADSSTLGGTFTINTDGLYAVLLTEMNSSIGIYGVSVNSNQLTTAIQSITYAHRGVLSYNGATGVPVSMGAVLKLSAADVVRVHAGTSLSTDTTDNCRFVIRKIG
jgi:hypothetical protein